MVTELFPLKLAFSRLSDEDPDMIETPDVDDIDDGDDDDDDGDFGGGDGSDDAGDDVPTE